MAVTQLGYLGLKVNNIEAWQRLATDILGFEVHEDDEATYFRFDERHHRIALFRGEPDGLEYVGWETANDRAFQETLKRVQAAGVEIVAGSAEECAQRRVRNLARFRDPNGFPVEVYHGPLHEMRSFVPSRPNSGFKAGALGLGHLVLRCANPERSVRFYCDVLGMEVTDTAELPRFSATFLHCNARHHSLALTTSQQDTEGTISHVMVETRALEDVGIAYELCQKNDVPLWLSLGQHTNDRMLSFYIRSPSGFGFELGYGGIEIDDSNWQVGHWQSGSFWGHKPAA